MIGLPELTGELVIKSIDFVHSLGIASHLTEFSPIPGTSVFNQLGFNDTIDPCLHNNITFPALNESMRKEMKKVKTYLSKLRLISNHLSSCDVKD